MSPELQQLLRVPPPEALDQVVLERALQVAQRAGVAAAARAQRAHAARRLWLLLRRSGLRLYRLGWLRLGLYRLGLYRPGLYRRGLRLIEPRMRGGRADTV